LEIEKKGFIRCFWLKCEGKIHPILLWGQTSLQALRIQQRSLWLVASFENIPKSSFVSELSIETLFVADLHEPESLNQKVAEAVKVDNS
jgi:hypothetical protein